MSVTLLTPAALEAALNMRDLSDELHGRHAMQLLLKAAHEVLAHTWNCPRLIYRSCPIVRVADNYDHLGYPLDGAARDARYTRYVSQTSLLRTQASASIPTLLRALSLDPPQDILLVCPALVYRRDVIDRIHVGEPHQLDIWRIKQELLSEDDLHEMIRTIVTELLPGLEYRLVPAEHPYTIHGRQIDVKCGSDWIEIGECGVASPKIIKGSGLNSNEVGGLAMGMGLDRILMLRKGIPDIRLLRSDDPRVAVQMLDLKPYKTVSTQPPIWRDLSVAVDQNMEAEEMGDKVRVALGEDVTNLEHMTILSETPYQLLPHSAHQRMGMHSSQKNVLVRLVIRHPTKTLLAEEANSIRDRVYMELHQGSVLELATSP